MDKHFFKKRAKKRRHPLFSGYRLFSVIYYFVLLLSNPLSYFKAFLYFLLRFARMIIAITAAARMIPITTRIIPIMLLGSLIPRI